MQIEIKPLTQEVDNQSLKTTDNISIKHFLMFYSNLGVFTLLNTNQILKENSRSQSQDDGRMRFFAKFYDIIMAFRNAE